MNNMAHEIYNWIGLQDKDISWNPILNGTITFNSQYQVVPTEGYLAWEYNPLRNYRLSQNMYEKDGKYYTEQELLTILNSINTNSTSVTFIDSTLKTPYNDADFKTEFGDDVYNEFKLYTLHESGELIDFITNELSFNINHPVELLPQYSYDGSVNLIMNDGLNIPRLINSRFTVTGKNTYKIIDRKGNNDTNIYDQGDQFDVDTSLFKNISKIPKLDYLGTSSGNMKIGNYHFYFKYSDSDGNESDWVAESGLVSVFIGSSPYSVNTGLRDENSIKSVRFKLSNIDSGYVYVKVYYTRYSGDVDSNLIVQAKRIDKNYLINNGGTCNILITGDENETEVTLEEINSSFDVIQNAQTQCSAANRLFMANIHKSKIEYDKLSQLSLRFLPYKFEKPYPLLNDGMSEDYAINANEDGYYDSQFIYDFTGYWPGELYRLGVVYILKDGSLSPVFNIRGATNLETYWNYAHENENSTLPYASFDINTSVKYSEEDYMITDKQAENENAKGIIQLSSHSLNEQIFPILGVQIRSNADVIKELKKYCKGFFFVRQKRMPLTLAQGMVIGLDKESRTPTLPTIYGVIDDINEEFSYVETKNKNDINYISEGFLSRYRFSIEEKPTEMWKRIGIGIAIVVAIAAAVVASIFTFGAAGVAVGAGLAATGIFTVTGTAVGVTVGLTAAATTALTVTGLTAAGLAAAVVVGETVNAGVKKIRQIRNEEPAKECKGRNDEIPKGYERKEKDESRKITHDLTERYIIRDPDYNFPEAVIVPDYQVNSPYYNQFLTGDEFTVKLNCEQSYTNYLNDGFFESKERHFYISHNVYQNDNRSYKVRLIGVPDGCPVKIIKDNEYCARAGYAEEAYKYEYIGKKYNDAENQIANSDIIRGNFGSYVGIYGFGGHACDHISIMVPGYQENKLKEYMNLRATDNSAFYAISDRIDINLINQKENNILQEAEVLENTDPFEITLYRGDCYICQYTHRIIRNFNDPSAPYNDIIVSDNSWKENYDPNNTEKYASINLGDVNAVQLGLWLTFQLRSSYNLNIRTIDKSHVDEYLMCGNYRSFYPYYSQLALGSQKIPDSDQYNKGFSKSVSEKYYFEVPDVPYIKQEFQNRIVFSDIHINDAYKNGFRVLRTMNHKDYPMTYGSITKLIEMKNALLIVFEHGIGLVSINNNSEHPSQILSDLNMISDTYGSQWKDSIIKTPSGIYGVDTIAKKIWRVKNGEIELLSDMKVQEFLNQNITLTERELTPVIGIRNVKTIYNAFKHDVMFTFYDNLRGIHEKSWNLCWNEILNIFTTFYSWIPAEMQNIDNIPFSFDRNTVKSITKLGISDHGNDFSEGITITNNVLKNVKDNKFDVDKQIPKFQFINKQGITCNHTFKDNAFDTIFNDNFIGFLHFDNNLLNNKIEYQVKYELLRDSQKNHTLFEIKEFDTPVVEVDTIFGKVSLVKLSYLKLKDNINPKDLLSELYWRNNVGHSYADTDTNKIGTNIKYDDKGNIISYDIHINKPIFKNKQGKRLMLDKKDQINPDKIVRYLNIKAKLSMLKDPSNAQEAYYNQFIEDNPCMIDAGYFESQIAITTDHNLSLLSTDFWKHGQAGIIDIADKIYPTYWYGQQHPFEFECVVADNPSVHKIFTNLELVANKVKPESFHYEIVGDVYDFSEDKPTMYFRQEALKALYQYNGYDIEYNPNFLEIDPKQHNRSADFPKYYSRWDTINEIYDSYKRFSAPIGFNYDHLSGAEIVYYPTRNEFRVWNHVEAIDADAMVMNKNGMLVETSILKANCRYLEDKWDVSINPIIVTYKNEFDKNAALADEKSIFFQEKDENNNYYYKYSTWSDIYNNDNESKKPILPLINIQGTKLEEKLSSSIEFPGISIDEDGNYKYTEEGKDNALYHLYDLNNWIQGQWSPIDPIKNNNRHETDVRGKFIKIRIRYSGEELAIIDFLNTIYQISYA